MHRKRRAKLLANERSDEGKIRGIPQRETQGCVHFPYLAYGNQTWSLTNREKEWTVVSWGQNCQIACGTVKCPPKHSWLSKKAET